MSGEELTSKAVRRQVAAMGLAAAEVGIRDQATGRMLLRSWSLTELNKALPWLRRQNLYDSDIYIRPQAEARTALVLLDDVTLGTLRKMAEDGFESAAVVQTSSMNYQAWVMLGTQALEQSVRTAAAKTLCQRYNADPASADWRHFGRLAGFTNRKPNRRGEDGRAPFVLLYEASGRPARAASDLLGSLPCLQEGAHPRRGALPIHGERPGDPGRYYSACVHQLQVQYGPAYDPSRGDWMIAHWMRRAGFNREEIAAAMTDSSPALDQRKIGHVADYINRTLDKVFG